MVMAPPFLPMSNFVKNILYLLLLLSFKFYRVKYLFINLQLVEVIANNNSSRIVNSNDFETSIFIYLLFQSV